MKTETTRRRFLGSVGSALAIVPGLGFMRQDRGMTSSTSENQINYMKQRAVKSVMRKTKNGEKHRVDRIEFQEIKRFDVVRLELEDGRCTDWLAPQGDAFYLVDRYCIQTWDMVDYRTDGETGRDAFWGPIEPPPQKVLGRTRKVWRENTEPGRPKITSTYGTITFAQIKKGDRIRIERDDGTFAPFMNVTCGPFSMDDRRWVDTILNNPWLTGGKDVYQTWCESIKPPTQTECC